MTDRVLADDVDAVVVGGGLAGLCVLHHLLKRGQSVRLLEAGAGVGGTWFWNRYPGARCDVESVDYSYSFDSDLEQEWEWTERYAGQPEILRYMEHVADRFDLWPHIRLETRVESAVYDEGAVGWTVRTDAGDELRARLCVMATGCLSTPQLPPIDGIERFAGEVIHPGQWPQDRSVDLRGRRVGIIGTGSTGIQIIPAVAPDVSQLTVFQRTANFSMPARNGPVSEEAVRRVKASYPERRRAARRTRRGYELHAAATDRSIFDFTAGERRDRLERGWAHGGVGFTSTFGDLGKDRAANDIAAEFVREQIRAIVDDPDTAERLCPTDHPLGGKRPCADSSYFETYNRSNVELVDLRETPITECTADEIRTTEAAYPLDALIVATGYDAITGTLNAIDIRGRDGELLRDRWAGGPTAYLGLCVSGFPNLFLITGPGSPSVLANMAISIEQHVELMLSVLDRADDGRLLVDADPDAEADWAEHVDEIGRKTMFVKANSWYMGANIPGKPRLLMPYAGGMDTFIDECHEIVADDYRGFRFEREAETARR